MPAKILIVDDHAIVRKAIQSILVLHSHFFQVRGEAGNGKEAIEKVIESKPDIRMRSCPNPSLELN